MIVLDVPRIPVCVPELTFDLKNKSAKSSTASYNKPITSYDKYKINYIAKKYKKKFNNNWKFTIQYLFTDINKVNQI